ncbi:mariner Mos1 transposase [Trichonephila clavipes]|nr:mariner Mos1 transposase [Trichonephila clavipes]
MLVLQQPYLVRSDLDVMYYKLLKPNKTMTGAIYQTELMRMSLPLKKNALLLLVSSMIMLFPMLEESVKTYMETLNWKLPCLSYSPDISPSNYHLFRFMVHGLSEQYFPSYENNENWIDSGIATKDEALFHGIRMLPQRCGKVVASNGQYFE